MNLRLNTETGKAEIQVGEDEWVNAEEAMLQATKENKSLRTYIEEQYGRVPGMYAS